MLSLIISLLAIGLFVGAVAPLLVPGRRNMPIVVTMVLGVLGSFTGGILGYLLSGRDPVAEGSVYLVWIAGATIGAVIVLLLFIAFGRRPTTRVRPGSRRRRHAQVSHVNRRGNPGPG